MRIRLLGSVQVAKESGQVSAGPAKQNCVLAVLALAPGRAVPAESLIDRVWGDTVPRCARDVLYQYVSRQRALGLEVRRTAAGYILELPADQIDLHRSRSLTLAAREAMDGGEVEAAAGLYRQAASLWRGTPLAGVCGDWAAGVRDGLTREHLSLLGERFEVELRGGGHAQVLPELSAALSAHPLAEVLACQVMLALFRCGRGAEALECFARTRQAIRDELGVEPGAALRELNARIARQDAALLDTAPAAGPIGGVVPRQLPPGVAYLAGRDLELSALDSVLDAGEHGPRIVCVRGTAGVGKTALVVHWAHLVADRFPDGQLYLNLRGFEPGGQALEPAQALRALLDSIGMPAERIPPDPGAQAGLYRSLLSGRRMLVVLDNARDAGQVLPLLAGGPTVMVVVASRNQLTGLVAARGAGSLALGTLSDTDARRLLVGRLGAARVAAEPAEVERIISACCGLPLALAIAAARAGETGFPLSAMAAELAQRDRRLDALDGGDPGSQVRAVFSWSYEALDPPAARLFRLLGLHPGPDISIPAAASLAAVAVPEARRSLVCLTRASLLTELEPGRYTLHGLMRVYAAELARSQDSGRLPPPPRASADQ